MYIAPDASACIFTFPPESFTALISIPLKFAPLPTKLVAVTIPATDTPVPTTDKLSTKLAYTAAQLTSRVSPDAISCSWFALVFSIIGNLSAIMF